MDSRSMTNILIGASRIKYTVLDDLFKPIKVPSDHAVNFIIDGYAMLYRLYQADYLSDIAHVDDDVFIQEFVSACMNTFAHYRRYIATRMKRTNRIFIVFNRIAPEYQAKLIEEWGEEYYARFFPDDIGFGPMNQLMNKAIGFVKELCQYFTDIFYLDTDGIEDHAAVYTLLHEYDKTYTIILSRNEIMLQYCSKICSVLYPKRDDSQLITSDTVGTFYFRKQKFDPKHINSDNIRHILCTSGIKSRDIKAPGIRGSVRIGKAIDKLIDSGEYLENMNAARFIKKVNNVLKSPYTDSQAERIYQLFKCVDGKLSYEALTRAQIRKMLQSRINLYDAEGLQQLNESLSDVNDVINITDLNMAECTTMDRFLRDYLDHELDIKWMEDM